MRDSFIAVPDWFSHANEGVGIAAASLAPGRSDLIVFTIDAPMGRNRGLYRVGKGADRDGKVTQGWTEWMEVPDWFSSNNEGAGIAAGPISGAGATDLVVLIVDAPDGPNRGFFRIGKGLDAEGHVTGGWTPWTEVPDWGSWSNQGAGIALTDLEGDGHTDLVVFMIDNPAGENVAKYRVGRHLDASGTVTGGWTPWQVVPNWFSWENQGAGVAVVDRPGGAKDLVVFHVDNPPEQNQAFYRFGRNLQSDGLLHPGHQNGKQLDPWTPWYGVPDWFSWNNQGASIGISHLRGPDSLQLLVITADSPEGQNAGIYQVLPLDEDPATRGSWELLPYDSEVLAVHAAVLPKGKVLFFAGSGNSGVRFADPDFGNVAKGIYCSVVWDPRAKPASKGSFLHPDTLLAADGRPVDFFCGGDTLLGDGRLFSSGGTWAYDVDGNNQPADHGFFGSLEAQFFDPVAQQWSPAAPMARGRWYPTLILLGNGQVLAASGLDETGHFNRTLELYTPDGGQGAWRTLEFPPLMELLGLPLYAHLFQLAGGEVFFTGGRMDDVNPMEPCLMDLSQDPVGVRLIHGLQAALSRNQSASVMLGPAQEQKFLLMGGAPPFGETDATDNVDVIDLSDLSGGLPTYQAAAPMLLPRVHLNAVLLPDRTVFVSGGALQREGGPQGQRRTVARLEAEIYDPERDRWTLGARASIVRMYHSIALLMEDGRVVTASGNPDKGSQVAWEPPDPNEELHLEVYSPPYMFRPRPVIEHAPEDWQYGQKVTIRSPQAGDILWASLIRPGVTTHSFNTSQRLVDLPIVVRRAGELDVVTPGERNIAPPGWYMLFLTDQARTPSEARWVMLPS